MKRSFNFSKLLKPLLWFVGITAIIGLFVGASMLDAYFYDLFELRETYELVSVDVVNQTDLSGSFSGAYLLGIGGSHGHLETTHKKIYEYWYKREDGGIIPATIDMSSYKDGTVEIVVYEDDTISPKIEIWRNSGASSNGDGYNRLSYTEFRFFIPSGSFVNTYDFQGTQNSDNSE